MCKLCNEIETVTHILFECRAKEPLRIWTWAKKIFLQKAGWWIELTIGMITRAQLIQIQRNNKYQKGES